MHQWHPGQLRAAGSHGISRTTQSGAGGRPLRLCVFVPPWAGGRGDAPPISFSVAPKRKRAVHGPKEKALWRKTARCALFAYDTGVPARDCGENFQSKRWARALVLVISISLASGLRRKLAHSDARPLPTKTASLGFRGGPGFAETFSPAPATKCFRASGVQT